MDLHSKLLAILALVLEAIIILKARHRGGWALFPLFYSYVSYVFCGSIITLLIYGVWPQYYSNAFWFYFLVTLVAEFAVLLELSDHIFRPYPAIRRLGRFLTLFMSATFFFLYILPSLLENRPSYAIVVNLVKRSSLTKAVIIIIILAATHHYRVPLGANVSAMMLGFTIYLATNVANCALLENYGWSLYGPTFSTVGPASYTLCLLVWTVSLWRYEPGLPFARELPEAGRRVSEPLSFQLGRFNTALTRLLRR